MEFIDIKFMIFWEDLDLLWIIENQISENPRNEHLSGNLQIDRTSEIQILQFICHLKAKN